jgi:rod shape-determining protein MreC
VYDKTVRRRRAVLALLVVCSIVLLTASFGGSGDSTNPLQRGVFEIVSPIQDGASRALKPFRDLFGWVGDTLHAKGQNKKLTKERDEYRQQVAKLQAEQTQNEELRKLLDMNQNANLDQLGPVQARVFSASPQLWLQQVIINKGRSDGVRKDMPVLTSAGLVGRVIFAGNGSATVKLITDPAFQVMGQTADGKVNGVVSPASGSPNALVMKLLSSSDTPIRRGDLITTRGTDGSLYPPNVVIGKVTSVQDAGTDAAVVHIRPAVNVRNVDDVEVLTKVGAA